MSDQERWLNEILDILGLPRDTAYRDYTRELAERGASLEQIYGTAVEPAEIIQTHVSLVFLVGDCAHKLKRAMKFPYLDFSTVEQRRVACEAELALNRRTAPKLYLEVRALTRAADGGGRLWD